LSLDVFLPSPMPHPGRVVAWSCRRSGSCQPRSPVVCPRALAAAVRWNWEDEPARGRPACGSEGRPPVA